ncbi:MAG TPA: FAD-dependent oxidoreductase [Nocardioidaceae bacterium]|nr:FAD-dependent oxidoreductase [Nocardioidaceae bacterium]
MAEVVVIGAGIAGMAAAARLAKLGHRVTIFEREEVAGGAVRRLSLDGFSWDLGPSSTSLPAVLRDLFRKSGRPLERYLDLQMPAVAWRHAFPDGSVVDLPTGSRAQQTRAVDAGLGAGAGSVWTDFVDAQGDVWDRFRRSAHGPDATVDAGTQSAPLSEGSSLDRRVARMLPDPRLQQMATAPLALAGSRLDQVPAWASLQVYVERTFGLWTVPEGLGQLSDVLVTRLGERRVEVRYAAPVTQILQDRSGSIGGVALADGASCPADVVVAALDPLEVFTRLLPTSAGGRAWLTTAGRTQRAAVRAFEAAARTSPPAVTHLGLRGANPADTAAEIVLHGAPPIAVSTTGTAPEGHRAWSIRRRGVDGVDVLSVLADRGLDLRGEVVLRVDRSPDDITVEAGSAWYTSVWDGAQALARRAALAAPLPGLYVPAAAMPPDASVPQTLWAAANAANRIGKASRS